MKNTIKLAAIGACALAVSSTAAFAGSTALSTLPAGVTTGLALGAPLPEGVYDISIASYGSSNDALNVAYAVPVWLIWSTPYQIAGGRVMLDTLTGVADIWTPGNAGVDSFLNTLVDAGIAWNLGGGWNFGVHAGVWLPSTQTLPTALGRRDAAFQGIASVSYVANGWNLTSTAIYNEGSQNYGDQPAFFNLDLTATKKLGKMEIGAIGYGSWQLDCGGGHDCPVGYNKLSQFALGGLVGYDFGSFIAQAKLAGDVSASDGYGEKEVRGTLTIIKPLWSPAAEGPLK
jgi:hypothetical protein